MKAVAQLLQATYWQVHIPEGWTAQGHSPEMVTLFSPNGVGMLEFFLCDDPYRGAEAETFGAFAGEYHGEKSHRGMYQRFWCLSCCGRALSVRYNCSEGNAHVDRAEVEELLQTLELRSDH
jgi:hypothetical protein